LRTFLQFILFGSGWRETYISSFRAILNNWSAKVNILIYTTKWRKEIFEEKKHCLADLNMIELR